MMQGILLKMMGGGWLLGANTKIQTAAAALEACAQEVLTAARENSNKSSNVSKSPSLLKMLLEAGDDNHTHLSDREIIDNIKIFLFAGHESTATTIIWVLYLLALHPEYLLRTETDATFRRCVIKETLRLFPPAWAINRSNKEDMILGGYTFPKGSTIMINTLRLHRREDLGWERPLDFMPQRWDHEQEKPHMMKAACCYMPFGAGPRSCVGQPLAEMEIELVVTYVLENFIPTLVGKGNDTSINFFAGSTIRPKFAHNLRLVRRQ
jgi:cytochrome P450